MWLTLKVHQILSLPPRERQWILVVPTFSHLMERFPVLAWWRLQRQEWFFVKVIHSLFSIERRPRNWLALLPFFSDQLPALNEGERRCWLCPDSLAVTFPKWLFLEIQKLLSWGWIDQSKRSRRSLLLQRLKMTMRKAIPVTTYWKGWRWGKEKLMKEMMKMKVKTSLFKYLSFLYGNEIPSYSGNDQRRVFLVQILLK